MLISSTIKKSSVFLSDLFHPQSLDVEGDDLAIKYYSDAEKITVTPLLFLNGSDAMISVFNKTTEQTPPELVIQAKKITLIGHGLVIDAHGRLVVASSAISEMGKLNQRANANLLIEADNHYAIKPGLKYRVIDEEVAIISQAGQLVYGHWLVDILPKISFMERIGFKGKYVLHEPTRGFSKELLKVLGIPLNRIIKYNPSEEGLYFPEALIPGSLHFRSGFSKGMIPYIKHMSNNVKATGNKKLFISRAELHNTSRLLSNSDELTTIASRHGYQIVYPEQLTLPQQLSLFASASVLAGEYGSGMHNSIFCHKNCKVLVFQPTYKRHFLQAGLCHRAGQSIGFVFGTPIGANDIYSINKNDANNAFEVIN